MVDSYTSCFSNVINYIDRQSLAVLWPEISQDLYPDKSSDEVKKFLHLSLLFLFSLMHLDKQFLARFLTG